MARAQYRRWTPEEKETLTRLYNEGKTTRETAECIGIPFGKVAGACSRLGLNRMGIPQNEYAAIRRDGVIACQSTEQAKERRRDYQREYFWEYRSRKASTNPGVTP